MYKTLLLCSRHLCNLFQKPWNSWDNWRFVTHAKTHVTCHKQPEVADIGNYITQCLNTQKLWPVPYSRIFTSVRKKLNNFARKINKRFDERWVLADLYQMQAALSNNISISSAIWQVLLVTDSLRDSACVNGAHRYKFKDQMCCPGYQRRSNTDEIMKSSFSCHRNCLLWTFFFSFGQWLTCHLPAFSSGLDKCGATCKSCNFEHWDVAERIAVYKTLLLCSRHLCNLFQKPWNSWDNWRVVTHAKTHVTCHKTICLNTQKLWPVLKDFSRLSERNYTNNFAQRIRRKMWYEMVFGRLVPTGRCTVKRHLNLLSHLASIASHRFTSGLRLCLRRSSAQVQPRLLERGCNPCCAKFEDETMCVYVYVCK